MAVSGKVTEAYVVLLNKSSSHGNASGQQLALQSHHGLTTAGRYALTAICHYRIKPNCRSQVQAVHKMQTVHKMLISQAN